MKIYLTVLKKIKLKRENMNFERGNSKYPTGNLLVYSNITSKEAVEIQGKIIAVNIVVSMLKVGGGNPVVSFPPVVLKDEEELSKIIFQNTEKYDIIKLSNFEIPTINKKIKYYFKKRMKELNFVALEYVNLCNIYEIEKNKLIPKKICNYNSKINDYIFNLANLSLDYRKFKGLTKKVTGLKVEQLIESFSKNYPQFDLQNFKKALSKPGLKGDKLTNLYLKKFIAISDRNYEEAADLKNEIYNIEHNK